MWPAWTTAAILPSTTNFPGSFFFTSLWRHLISLRSVMNEFINFNIYRLITQQKVPLKSCIFGKKHTLKLWNLMKSWIFQPGWSLFTPGYQDACPRIDRHCIQGKSDFDHLPWIRPGVPAEIITVLAKITIFSYFLLYNLYYRPDTYIFLPGICIPVKITVKTLVSN